MDTQQKQVAALRTLLTRLRRRETEDKEAAHSIPGEFVRLKKQSIKYREDKIFVSKSAESQDNIKKNRYKDILPFDHSRVKLTLTTSKSDTDYINANFIKGVTGSNAYIATQGPLHHTVQDFLRMLWEYDVKVIVMACREFEMGKKKCERYWPEKEESSFVCGPFAVFRDCEEDKGAHVTRTLRLTYDNCCRTLKQLHYVDWPDHGVPNSILPILDMLEEMRSYQPHDHVPICVHCSAGCGRTGALCVIDYTWNLLRTGLITSDFNVCDLVRTMRTQRPSVVQTKEQYELVYSIIGVLFVRYLQCMDAQSRVTGTIEREDERERQPICDEDLNIPVSQDHEMLTSAPESLVVTEETDKEEYRVQAEKFEDDPVPPNHPKGTVEDTYFHSPQFDNIPRVNKRWTVGPIISKPSLSLYHHTMESHSSPFTGAHTDEDIPPPLPERTPESYQLAVHADIPASPAPSLPDRTPESYELACHQAPVGNQRAVTPAVNLSRIGTSSEWSGTSRLVSATQEAETKPWLRTKSLRAKMTLTEAPQTPLWLPSSPAFAGAASEAPQTPLWLPSSPAFAGAGSASAQVSASNHKWPLSDAAEVAADKNEDKEPSRKKSLRLFKHQQKLKPTAALPQLSSSSKGVLTSMFTFGFGRRIGRPKGPRSYPQNWSSTSFPS
ncbi:tyrosine-protein phosphatase non-receptor type 22 isoform X2 [Entelurus aequoreus]|uniref:tyrosine-protein phosphatase non-receptor type 22 isoform X2 n=1 Tax=Entelurus aequoreus TaxID=161455 RepID=UPI002B1DAF25|nr:tyrosine-protein phosphatase non-receptor type 22 isoform X2 [Entelurus aequoreus]